jgi:PAS domain S-box-containing protein
VFDRDRNFRGYRGFGVCRDVARIADPTNPPQSTPKAPQFASATAPPSRGEPPALVVVPSTENVVPFRTAGAAEKTPALTAVERKAFHDLASRLSARLHRGNAPAGRDPGADQPPLVSSPPSAPADGPRPADFDEASRTPQHHAPVDDQRPLLDRLPIGLLVYRLDALIYANRAFLEWTGYRDLDALEQAGGLDMLFVEPGAALPTEDGAKSLVIATNQGERLPVEARLSSTPWDGESAFVLMLSNGGARARPNNDGPALLAAPAEARELRAILDTATDGVVVLGHDGHVQSVNRGAEALFGYHARDLAGLPIAHLFAPDSRQNALDYLTEVVRPDGGGLRDAGRELTGRAQGGGAIPLFMTAGLIDDGTGRVCAAFRDLTAWRNSERDLLDAKRQAEKASAAKSDFLAKVSHEIRTPLNAIIGFAEVMMQERFGPVGNERYRQYLKDVHASGGHLISLLNDLLDLSKIEAGKLELSIASVDLNELTRQSVALMQEQANRGRIIIRTSLATALPPVLADARSVRQILLNLLSNSIKFTGAGGQIIVSTAPNDSGEAVLRVRDTGAGMSEQDIAVALEPFRQLATAPRWGSNGTGLGLPLTKALAEANRASFRIRSAVNAGTLVEVAFPRARVAAE